MRSARRRWVLFAALLAALVVLEFLALWNPAARHVPGTYTMAAPDGTITTVRYAPDGSYTAVVQPPGSPLPAGVTRGRWRLSGRVLVVETGPAAAAGPVDRFFERFRSPLLTPTGTRVRVVSADVSGLVLSHGRDVDTGEEVTSTLSRR